jgi:hypothetical protein
MARRLLQRWFGRDFSSRHNRDEQEKRQAEERRDQNRQLDAGATVDGHGSLYSMREAPRRPQTFLAAG